MATLAAKGAGTCSLFPGYITAPKHFRVLALKDRKEWIPGGQLAGSAMTDLGTPSSQAGQNGLSHLSPKGRSPRYGRQDLEKTGVVFCQGSLCAVENEASRRGEGGEEGQLSFLGQVRSHILRVWRLRCPQDRVSCPPRPIWASGLNPPGSPIPLFISPGKKNSNKASQVAQW